MIIHQKFPFILRYISIGLIHCFTVICSFSSIAELSQPSLATLDTNKTTVVVYKHANGVDLRLFIEKPVDWKVTNKRSAVVFFFGGGWIGGTPQQFVPQSEYFAKRGLVGIRVEYRTLPKYDKGPPVLCCSDSKSAIRYVRLHAADLGIDPSRIAAAGGSAGGHLAALTALVPGLDDTKDDLSVSCRPDALLLFNPVYDNSPGNYGANRMGDRYREFSPAQNITSNAPPTIVFLGMADDLVPVSTAEHFEAAMKRSGNRCETFLYPAQKHGFFNREPYLTKTLIEADKFLQSLGWLKDATTVTPDGR